MSTRFTISGRVQEIRLAPRASRVRGAPRDTAQVVVIPCMTDMREKTAILHLSARAVRAFGPLLRAGALLHFTGAVAKGDPGRLFPEVRFVGTHVQTLHDKVCEDLRALDRADANLNADTASLEMAMAVLQRVALA